MLFGITAPCAAAISDYLFMDAALVINRRGEKCDRHESGGRIFSVPLPQKLGCYNELRMAQNPKTQNPKIGMTNAVILLVVAGIVDTIQIVLSLILIGLIVNPIINIFVSITFVVWLHAIGVHMGSATTITRLLGTIVGEFIPIVNTLPLWTGFILTTVLANRFKPDILK